MKAKLTLEDGRVIDIELTTEQEKAIEIKKTGRWNPENWDTYYFPKTSSVVAPEEYKWINDHTDNNLYKHWLVFQTSEEAQFYLDKREFIVKVNDRIDELNDWWIPDWSNKYQKKYYIYSGLSLEVDYTFIWNFPNIFHYMKSKEIANKIISEFKDNLIKYIFN